MKKIHWRPTEPVSWPCGGRRNPNYRCFLLAGNIVCSVRHDRYREHLSTADRTLVTCGTCLLRMKVARVDTKEALDRVLARGTP